MIGPFDFMVMRSKRADELEARIDASLREAVNWSASVAVTVAIKGYPTSAVDAVVARYREKGWKIEVVADARDGDFISLELPR